MLVNHAPQCCHPLVLTTEATDGPSHPYVPYDGDYDGQAHHQFSHQSHHLPYHHLLKEKSYPKIAASHTINTTNSHIKQTTRNRPNGGLHCTVFSGGICNLFTFSSRSVACVLKEAKWKKEFSCKDGHQVKVNTLKRVVLITCQATVIQTDIFHLEKVTWWSWEIGVIIWQILLPRSIIPAFHCTIIVVNLKDILQFWMCYTQVQFNWNTENVTELSSIFSFSRT